MGFLMFGLWALSLGLGLPIGNTAHLGGLIVGLGYGFYLKRAFPKKTEMISRYFSR
jgi:membrane associated rhomboid family serine protease